MGNNEKLGDVDYSIKAKLENAGISTEKISNGIETRNHINTDISERNGVMEQKRHSVNKHDRNHGGNGRRANQTALSLEVAEIKKIRDRIKRDLGRFEEDTKIANQEISEIKARIKDAEVAGQADAVKNWGIRLKNAEGLLKMLGKTAPSIDPLSDIAIRKKLQEYGRARDLQTHAELKGDNGEYIRQQALAVSIKENIEGLLKKRDENPAVFNAVRDESISNIRTEGAEIMSTVQSGANPEDVFILAPEGSVSGSPELAPQESVVENMDQGGMMGTGEDARINIPQETLAEQAEIKTTQATADDWQNEAIKNWGETSGKKVPDLELEHTPEEHNAILPMLTEVISETMSIPQERQEGTFTRPEALVEAPKLGLTPEQVKLVKQFENNIADINSEIEARAEKAGMSEKMLSVMRFAGEEYSKLPLKTKLIVSVTLFGIAWTVGGTIASVAIGGSLFQRALGGLATFVGVEGLLKAGAEKGGHERGEWEKRRQTAVALVAGYIVGGGILGHALQNVFHEVTPSHEAIDAELAQGKANLAATEHLNPTNVPVEGGAAAEAANLNQFIKIAEAGDSRWSLVERVLAEGPYKDLFNAISSDEQRAYIIDALKDKVTAGMTAEQANTLNVGDKIDFQNIFVDGEFMDKTFSDAQNLSPEELTNIQNFNTEIPVETTARVLSTDEFLGQPLLTDFTPPEQPGITIPAEAGKLTDNLISSNTDIPAPEQVATTPSAVSAETIGLVSLSTAATMPQEFAPKNPQILAYIDQQFHDDVHTLFGKRGILGFGRVDGIRSPHWLDFENRTFDEIKSSTPTGGPDSVGINNPEAHKKMQSYLMNVSRKSMIPPEEGEAVGKYIKRAMEITASRLQTK